MQFHAEMDIKWMKQHPEFQMFSNFGFEGKTVFVTKDWISKHTTDLDQNQLSDTEIYETTLSISGFHNVETGRYGLEVNKGFIEHGDTSKTFMILIDGEWKRTRPFDHKGFYAKAKKLGY